MTDPTPALIPGDATDDDAGPAFDPTATATAARNGMSAMTASGHEPGDFTEPPAPMLPPAGVELPAELVEAIEAHDAVYDRWRDAVEAVEDYQEEAQQSRNKRAAAIRAAGAADAKGEKRPSIPKAISEAEEATEVEIRSHVVNVRRGEVATAASKVDALVSANAGRWVEPVAARFAPALAEARRAVAEAYQAAERAEAVVSQVARLRGMAYVEDLRAAGERPTRTVLPSIVGEFLKTITGRRYREREANYIGPLHVLTEAQKALDALAEADLTALPHPDTVGAIYDRPSWQVWLKTFHAAPEAARKKIAQAINFRSGN